MVEVAELNSPNSGGSSEIGFPSSNNVFRDLCEPHHISLDDWKALS